MNNQDDAPVAKRARMVVFEPIRLPSVYNVKALNSTILPAQYYKLTERVRIKQRQIATLEKRMEELENRHSSDEELICIINQQWNQLDDIMVDLLRRFVNEGNIDEIVANKRAETNWLTILSQLNNDEINQRLSSRVNFSTEALSHLLKAMNTYSQKRERILAFLDRQRKRNNDSPETNAEDSRDALDQSQELSDENKIVDIDAALRQEIIDIAAENKRLEEQNVKWRSEKSRLRAKIAAHDEEMELMQSKVENAVNQMEDLRYELEKSAAREEKLESVIIELKKKEEMISPPETKEPSTTKEKPTENKEKTDVPGVNQTQFEELQHELEMQTELAEKRLNEIQNLSTVNQQLAEKVAELDMSIKYLPTSVISNSPDYMCLKFKYSQLLDEAKRVDQNNQELLKHVVDLRKCYEDQLRSMKDEFNTGMQRMQENCTTMTTELLSVKKECAQMELEFKTKFEVDAIESRTYNEMKLLIDAARTDGNRKTEDMNRMKKQIVTLKAEVAKTKESLDEARKIYDTCIVIPFEDKPQAQEPDSATRSSQAAASTSTAPAPVPPPMISDKRIKIESSPSKRYETKYRPNSRTSMKPEPEDSTEQSRRQSPSIEDTSKMEIEGNDLKAKVGPIENVDQETQSKVDISAREKRLQKENEVLREKIQKYHRTEKIGGLERAKRAIQYLTEQNERLKRDLNTSSQAEGGLMKEIEMMSKAVEDLMKQGRNAEQDTTYVRLVKDGLQSEATLRVAKQTIDTLEEKMRITENELEALRIECNTVEEKSKLLEAAKETLETNLRKTKEAMEICRRSSLNVSSDLNELKIRHEKQTLEVQELRQQLKDRAGKTEETRTKMARIREERNQLRKKLARAKQATEFDNFDQLLEAENRTLRESLACPSCKTNDKNTVLTKCFHVFCMDCIKRRYDARSRKCPKCNATFGANDYHRIYFE